MQSNGFLCCYANRVAMGLLKRQQAACTHLPTCVDKGRLSRPATSLLAAHLSLQEGNGATGSTESAGPLQAAVGQRLRSQQYGRQTVSLALEEPWSASSCPGCIRQVAACCSAGCRPTPPPYSPQRRRSRAAPYMAEEETTKKGR